MRPVVVRTPSPQPSRRGRGSKARLASLRVGLMVVALAATLLGGSVARADVSTEIFDYPYPILEWGYGPSATLIESGEWVTWSNAGSDPHTVTAVDESFDSFTLMAGEGFSWYFDQPGVYDYYCTLHDWMRGQVLVGAENWPPPLPATVSQPEVSEPASEPMPAGGIPLLAGNPIPAHGLSLVQSFFW